MEKAPLLLPPTPLLPKPTASFWTSNSPLHRRGRWVLQPAVVLVLLLVATIPYWSGTSIANSCPETTVIQPAHQGLASPSALRASPYGDFPVANDPFRFLPCTGAAVLPALNNSNAPQAWAAQFDPNPDHWNWGAKKRNNQSLGDPFAGRGIYLCGYLDVPLDYTNKADPRVARLAVTKYQVLGLASSGSPPGTGKKSNRTIVVEPGGPGGSGVSYAWGSAEAISRRFSDDQFDVLGWDPRGVNSSLPSISCFPEDADRDRWYLLTSQFRATVSRSPRDQLEIADAMNEATFRACFEKYGDIGRFLGTSFVARDMEEIRIALGEDELTGYLVSYGTGIGQTYAGMFPDSVGRVILDGTEYVRDHRVLGGFGFTALDNITNAWHDGFLGECVKAGPKYCALAQPRDGKPVTLPDLDRRMSAMFSSLAAQPLPGYTKKTGPSIITYSALVSVIYGTMYSPRSWPPLAEILYDLEGGNTTSTAAALENNSWYYDPTLPCPAFEDTSSEELFNMVVCGDSYDAPEPAGDLDWWLSLWANMTTQAWIGGDSRFYSVFPCRRFKEFWPKPAEVFRGDLSYTLKHPVLLIAETYDPATPLRNGRRLAQEMGPNARLIVHHGYGHSSTADNSDCTIAASKAFILNGTLPEKSEIDCYANEKPYLYGVKLNTTSTPAAKVGTDPVAEMQENLRELEVMDPRFIRAQK
ncbi:Alpha/Beta hydrolase protein [Apodospora peruviana]|uniref:Alpha/Beta hydrolase protein n=1 Tax=Apodospora peruviana TaxID=516989 RepID=A0AAE0IBP3_9PEZI|nr:Alpha/Beta hydrolase protein [Apodospora peruviana]